MTSTRPRRGRPAGPWSALSTRAGRAALSLVLVVALAALTWSVVHDGWSARLDDAVAGATPGDRGPGLPGLAALAVVDAATPPVWVVGVLVVAVVSARASRRWSPLLVVVPAVVVLTATVLLGKATIDRPAPGLPAVLDGSGSYPSGHTATALVCSGVLAVLAGRWRPRWARTARVLAAGWTVLVAASLVWLHFHWVSDVVGSVLLGGLVLLLVVPWALGWADRALSQGH